jgi:carbamoylphosphate synthase small subunit
MSAMHPKATDAPQDTAALFDDLVGNQQKIASNC